MTFAAKSVQGATIGSLVFVLGNVACTNKDNNQTENLTTSLEQASQGAATSAVARGSMQRQVVSPGQVIQSQEANTSGVVSEILESKRSDGVLTVKVRFRNTSDKPLKYLIHNSNFTSFYVTAGSKKYFILKDSEGTYLTAASTERWLEVPLEPGQSYVWWAKYPAPPPETRKINFVTPLALPFEDIPITDA